MSVSTVDQVGRVLVIAEDPIDRARLDTLLTEAGYAVDTAIDAIHAAELAALRDYGLIVTPQPPGNLAGRLAAISVVETCASADLLADVGERLGPPGRQAPPMVDFDRLERLRADMAADLFSQLLNHYLHGGRERLVRIAGFVERGDLKALAREAHDLKGISATFGAEGLRRRAGALERAAKAKDVAAVGAALPALRVLAEETWACFEQELLARKDDRE